LWNKNQIQILCIIEPLEEKNLLSWAENVAAFLKMNCTKIKFKFSAKLSHWKKKNLFKLGRKCCSTFKKMNLLIVDFIQWLIDHWSSC